MATQVQFRRGTTAEIAAFTGVEGEVVVDTTKETCVVCDGATQGGFPLLREDGTNSKLAPGSLNNCAVKFADNAGTGLISPSAGTVALVGNGIQGLSVTGSGDVVAPNDVLLTGDLSIRCPATTYPPSYKTSNFTVDPATPQYICNGTSTITVVLPDAATYTGLEIRFTTIANRSVVSASNNVIPLGGGSSGTALLRAVAGDWATLMSNGFSWVIISSATAVYAATAGVATFATTAGTAKPDNLEPSIFYVRSDGSNSSNGRNAHTAFRNIEHAIAQIENFSTPTSWTIKLLDGLSTSGELHVPDYTTIISANMQRRTVIRPTAGNESNNVFLCGNGVHLYGLKFVNWQVNDFEDPTGGFAMAFRPGAIILPGGVPYGQNCVVTSETTSVPTPFETNPAIGNYPNYPRGGGCVLADASVLSAYSVFPNIMTWGFTPAVANGLGYVARNRGFINPVNAIGVGAHRHFMCLDGGQMVVSGSSSQFGDYSFWSEGSTTQIVPLTIDPNLITTQGNSTEIINNQRTALINDLWNYLVASYGAGSWSADIQALTRKDAGLFLDALASALTYGFERPMLNFAEGMFKFNGDCVYTYSTYHAAFQASWTRLATNITTNAFGGGNLDPATQTMVNALVTRLKATMDNYWYQLNPVLYPAPSPVEPVRKKLRSLITAINHQWTSPFSGVEFLRVPPAKSARLIQRSIVQRGGGKVVFSGQDDAGNACFVGGLTIDARSGQLGGPPFDSAIRNRVTRAAISRSY